MTDNTEREAPVKIETQLRRLPSGNYEIGARFDDHSWVWGKLTARRRDVAERRSTEALALLMKNHAETLEAWAEDLMTKASFLRDCARLKGVL